jgi:hypothetical protein
MLNFQRLLLKTNLRLRHRILWQTHQTQLSPDLFYHLALRHPTTLGAKECLVSLSIFGRVALFPVSGSWRRNSTLQPRIYRAVRQVIARIWTMSV